LKLKRTGKKTLEGHLARKRCPRSNHIIFKEKNALFEFEIWQQVLVLQDFTQLQVQGTFYQDLIIGFYCFFDPARVTRLEKQYFHFIAPARNTKNDIKFVMGFGKEMIQMNLFAGFNKNLIFSDGGPKHFKLSGTINFFGFLQNSLGSEIEYHSLRVTTTFCCTERLSRCNKETKGHCSGHQKNGKPWTFYRKPVRVYLGKRSMR